MSKFSVETFTPTQSSKEPHQFNKLDTTTAYSYSDYLAKGNSQTKSGQNTTSDLSLQESLSYRSKVNDLKIKNEKDNQAALKEIEGKKRDSYNPSSWSALSQVKRQDYQFGNNPNPKQSSSHHNNLQPRAGAENRIKAESAATRTQSVAGQSKKKKASSDNIEQYGFSYGVSPNEEVNKPTGYADSLFNLKNIENFESKNNFDNFVEMPLEYDLEAALSHLRSNAHKSSQGYCGTYVRNAIAAGGLTDSGSYYSAKNYVNLLPKLGFTKIDAKNYTPQPGDVVIHEAQTYHPDGHAAMFDGKSWISDFMQIDMYGGGAYRNNPNYTLWRR